MRWKTKVTITKILLFIMTGAIGYYMGKYIYLWWRKKYNITTKPNLLLILLACFALTLLPNAMLVLIYYGVR